jgi:hypothetical protein
VNPEQLHSTSLTPFVLVCGVLHPSAEEQQSRISASAMARAHTIQVSVCYTKDMPQALSSHRSSLALCTCSSQYAAAQPVKHDKWAEIKATYSPSLRRRELDDVSSACFCAPP